MKNSLSTRLTYRIMAVVLAMMAVIAGLVYFKVRESMLFEAQARYLAILRKIQGESRRITSVIDMSTRNNAHDIEEDLDNPEKLFSHVERIVRLGENIVCSTILFEPYHFPDKGRLFIPCARRDANGNVRVWQIDSTYRSQFSDVWYQELVRKDTCDWSKPYIESQLFAGNDEPRLLRTFVVPLHNREGRLVALLLSDLSLVDMGNILMKELEQVRQKYEEGCSQHSYTFSFSYDGVYLNHPDVQRIVNKNFIAEVKETPDTLDDHLLKDMMNNPEGSAMVTIDGVPSWIYYLNIDRREMVGAIVVPEEVIYRHGRRLNTIILLLLLGGMVAIYFICRREIKGIADPVAMQKANLEHELKIANAIQMSMLPRTTLLASEAGKPGDNVQPSTFDIHASLTPARDVGGDLYDYFLRDDRLFFCIGDVSGKGMPAALLMAVVRAMFRSEARRADSAVTIVDAINRNLNEEYTAGYFVTMFVGILDLTNGRLDYCNAGHEQPLVAGRPLPVERNLPVGALPDWHYVGQQAQLQPGDMLFLYTDGLSEAEDSQHVQLGRRHVQKLAADHANDTTRQLVELMESEVRTHAADTLQSDDITLLAIKWNGNENDNENGNVGETLTMSASMAEIGRLQPYIERVSRQAGMDDKQSKRLRLAVEEAVANVINHSGATTITLSSLLIPEQSSPTRSLSPLSSLIITIDDDGQPFDPTVDSATDFSVPADQRPPGGLGIMFLHQMADGLDYQRVDGHNRLTIKKNVNRKT